MHASPAGGWSTTDRLAELADAIAALFTEDGVWDGGPGLGSVQGRDAIAARLRAPTLTFSRHLFTSPRIEVEGNRASARWDLLSPCNRPDGTAYWMCGYEDDTYARGGRRLAPRHDAAHHRLLRPERGRMGAGARLNRDGAGSLPN